MERWGTEDQGKKETSPELPDFLSRVQVGNFLTSRWGCNGGRSRELPDMSCQYLFIWNSNSELEAPARQDAVTAVKLQKQVRKPRTCKHWALSTCSRAHSESPSLGTVETAGQRHPNTGNPHALLSLLLPKPAYRELATCCIRASGSTSLQHATRSSHHHSQRLTLGP